MKTVKMVRSQEAAGDRPAEADVHPDEVENMKASGWQEAEAQPRRAKAEKAREKAASDSDE